MTETESKSTTTEPQPITPIEVSRHALLHLRGQVGKGCSVTDRCKEVATVQVNCLCKVMHYGVNSCETHIATAVRRVTQGGCEVEVCRIYAGGKDMKLFEHRRADRRKLERHELFLQELLAVLAQHDTCPDREDFTSSTEHLKAVVRYAYADFLRDKISHFRNSVSKS